MNNLKASELALWQRLASAGIVSAATPPETEQHNAWYIRLLQGFAGWLAACFLMVSFGIALLEPFLNDENALLIFIAASLCTTAALFIFKAKKQHDFTQQLALALNLCAQLLFTWALILAFNFQTSELYLAIFLVQLGLIFLLPNQVSRVLSSWFAMIALFLLFQSLGINHLSSALTFVLFTGVWLADLRWKAYQPLWQAVGYGLTLSVLMFSGQFFLIDITDLLTHAPNNSLLSYQITYWINQSIIALLFCYLIFHIYQIYNDAWHTATLIKLALLGVLIIALSYLIIGVSGAILLLCVGFLKQRRSLVILGSLSLIGFISWYYYSLQWTLLYKALVLLGLSVALAIAAYVLHLSMHQRTLNIAVLKQKYRFSRNSALACVVLLTVLVAVNFTIYKKEKTLSSGQIVLLELAPVDPRSLMQGDYMRLRFHIESTLLKQNKQQKIVDKVQQALFIVELDSNKVGSYADIFTGQTLANNQIKMQFRIRNNQIRLATHAFFFEEGSAQEYERAEYGEFRVAANGELLLNNMRDKDFKIIGYNRPAN